MISFYEKNMTVDLFDDSGVRILPKTVIAKNQKAFSPHCHDQLELIRVISGSLKAETDNGIFSASAGSLLIFAPNTLHRGFAEENGVVYSCIIFDIKQFYNKTEASQKYLTPMLEEKDIFVGITDESSVIAAADALLRTKADGAHPLEAVSCIYRLLGELWTCCTEKSSAVRSYEMVSKAIKYIEQNYSEALSVSKICTSIGYSPSYFSQKFKEHVGMSPSEYIMRYRVEAGYRLIINGQRNISVVSELCGFSDQNYFARCFKKHFGHPPTYYAG